MTCGSGTRHREVSCYRKEEKIDDVFCNYRRMPATSEPCNLGSCPLWKTGPWEPVSDQYSNLKNCCHEES